jgi:hypothetical protein
MTARRFVILQHDHPCLHWDFLIEAGDGLRAWRLLAEPGYGRPVDAEASFDHRRMYLDYEGPVSGGRGSVTRWDEGTFETESDAERRITLRMNGRRLKGRIELERSSGEHWRWTCQGDPSE